MFFFHSTEKVFFFRCCEALSFFFLFVRGGFLFGRTIFYWVDGSQPCRPTLATCPHLLACAVKQNNERFGWEPQSVLKVVQGPRRPRCLCLVRVQPSPSDDVAKPTVLPVRLASWFTSFASISGILHSRRKITGGAFCCCTGYRQRQSRDVAVPAKMYQHII